MHVSLPSQVPNAPKVLTSAYEMFIFLVQVLGISIHHQTEATKIKPTHTYPQPNHHCIQDKHVSLFSVPVYQHHYHCYMSVSNLTGKSSQTPPTYNPLIHQTINECTKDAHMVKKRHDICICIHSVPLPLEAVYLK